MSAGIPRESTRAAEVSLLVAAGDRHLEEWAKAGLAGLRAVVHVAPTLPMSQSGGALDSAAALRAAFPDDFDPDLALIEESPEGSFADRLRAFKGAYPRCQLLLLGRQDSDLSPRKLQPVAIRHWFFRPVDSDEVSRVLAAAGRSLRRQWQEQQRHGRSLPGFDALLGEDPRYREAIELAKKVAASPDTNVLILGETGTGKGMLAQAIHSGGPRSAGPFLDINCSAIPRDLIESELFGHVKGAFTSAVKDKPGLLELADGGAAFLDEIGELDSLLQAKLLKFLDQGRLRRVQGTEEIRVDVRVIAATNRDLEAEVAQGRFRLDLFHRLNVVPIRIPSLRERPDDIVLLAERMLPEIARRLRGWQLDWEADALAAMRLHSWPGNVRELVHVIERMVLLLDTARPLRVADLPEELKPKAPLCEASDEPNSIRVTLPEGGISLAQVERAVLEAALGRAGGNVTEAARFLRMSRGRLRYRLAKLGLADRASRRRGRPARRRRAA